MEDQRPSWASYFLDIAKQVSTRATCPRAQVGCVLVKDKRILSTGYNGSPPTMVHCLEEGCVMENEHCVRTVHAEANAVAQAARHGISILGSSAFVTHTPCHHCQLLLLAAGVVNWVNLVPYP